MPSAQKPAGAEDAERALSREQPVAADAAAPTPANQGSASAEGAEFIEEDLQQDPPGNGDLLRTEGAKAKPEKRKEGMRHPDSRTTPPRRQHRRGGSVLSHAPPTARDRHTEFSPI